jgi:hypothetical protein
MSQAAVERVLGRLVTDAVFRTEFFIEPVSLCRDQGFDLTHVEMAALRRLDEGALRTLGARLDPKIVRAVAVPTSETVRRLGLTRGPRYRRAQRGAE